MSRNCTTACVFKCTSLAADPCCAITEINWSCFQDQDCVLVNMQADAGLAPCTHAWKGEHMSRWARALMPGKMSICNNAWEDEHMHLCLGRWTHALMPGTVNTRQGEHMSWASTPCTYKVNRLFTQKEVAGFDSKGRFPCSNTSPRAHKPCKLINLMDAFMGGLWQVQPAYVNSTLHLNCCPGEVNLSLIHSQRR